MVTKVELANVVAVVGEQALEIEKLQGQLEKEQTQWRIPSMPATKPEGSPVSIEDLKFVRRINVLDDGQQYDPDYWYAAFFNRQGGLSWLQTLHLHPLVPYRFAAIQAMLQGARQILEQTDPYTLSYPMSGHVLDLHRRMQEMENGIHQILMTMTHLEVPPRIGDTEKFKEDEKND